MHFVEDLLGFCVLCISAALCATSRFLRSRTGLEPPAAAAQSQTVPTMEGKSELANAFSHEFRPENSVTLFGFKNQILQMRFFYQIHFANRCSVEHCRPRGLRALCVPSSRRAKATIAAAAEGEKKKQRSFQALR